MLNLFFSPQSRSTRLLALVHELGMQDKIKLTPVSIARSDGSGGADPANPHPEKKVPVLVDGETVITESGAIMLYLTDMFPDAHLGPRMNDAQRGTYLMWLFWYGDVVEPVYNLAAAGIEHPIMTSTFRGVPEVEARLITAFADGRDFVLGSTLSAADLLIASPYFWFPDWAPKNEKVRAWIDRVKSRPSMVWAMEYEQENAV